MAEQVVPSVEPNEMNWLSRVFNIIFEPRKVFESLKQKPKWFVPFIVVCILGIGFYYFAYPIIMMEQIHRIDANEKYTDAQKESMKQYMGRTEHPPIIQFAFQPLGVGIIFLALSGVLFFVFNVLLGGDSTFKRVLSVVSHSYMIAIPTAIVKYPLVFIKKTVDVPTSLALLLSVDMKDSFMYRFLDGFDVFTLWQVVVLSLGMSVMYKFSFKKSLVPICSMWVLLILIGSWIAGALGGLGGF